MMINPGKARIALFLLALPAGSVFGQIPAIADSATNVNTDFHFQLTTVSQFHPKFNSPYQGANSLVPEEPSAMTMTATIFWGVQIGKLGEFYINPEIAGGSGISSAKGIAGFTNGEAFRVGDPAPSIYVARAYLKHTFNFGGEEEYFGESANQVNKTRTAHYLEITAGKYSIADFYDKNSYSHDPRSQFMNWSLMSGGGWDYPANVRGYTWGIHVEYGKPGWAVRTTAVMVPQDANGNDMDLNVGQARSHALEFEKTFQLGNKPGAFRVLGFYTLAKMGNYNRAVQANPTAPDITSVRSVANTKYGLVLNFEQGVGQHSGLFARASWNDGQNETWAFTEIDHSFSFGFVNRRGFLHKQSDEFGIATVVNGISRPHRDYLGAGGYGFIIGDGRINYAGEWTTEVYYKINLFYSGFWITPDYQFVLNPAYNRDRGPAHIFAIRAHIEL